MPMLPFYRNGQHVRCKKCGGNVMLQLGDYPEARCLQCGWEVMMTKNEILIAESMNHIPNYVKLSK